MSESSVPDPTAMYETASELEREVWEALWTVDDPELPVSIVDLGLVYDVTVADGHADVAMTLTYSGCPARELIIDEVTEAVESVPGIESVDVTLVYSPPWTLDNITARGREKLSEWGMAVPEASKSTDLQPRSDPACES